MIKKIQVKCEIFQEDDLYVALCPELNVSSFGETIPEAKASLEEALLAFLEECERMNVRIQVKVLTKDSEAGIREIVLSP